MVPYICDTSSCGYIQRRLVKALEDVTVEYDQTVRNSQGDILQFRYGDDSFDGTSIERQSIDSMLLDNSELYRKYHLIDVEYDLILKERDLFRNILPKIDNSWNLPINLKRLILFARRTVGTVVDPHYAFRKVSELCDFVSENLLLKMVY